jgi:aminoglycoside phosphotransferase (APT) family kinase protein
VPDLAEVRHSQLINVLRGKYNQLRISDLRHIGEGMDAKVYHAYSPALGQVAVKMPHARLVSSGNELRLDTRRLLQQEWQLSRHLRAHGLPVPEVFLLHTDDDSVDFILSEFIESDRSELSDAEFGGLIRAIHELPVPAIELVASQPSSDADEVLTERIERRLKKLAAIVDRPSRIPDIGSALAVDSRNEAPTSLLHMDLRPANILVRSGRPVAVLDWSNALVGEAALDLARAAEYGSLTAPALAAYGKPAAFSMTPKTPREIVYRLDTAVMLSHVFLNGAPDAVKARQYIERTADYCRALLPGT